jgi:GDP-4-dehydro-6-deoxy-D-mannose reductase
VLGIGLEDEPWAPWIIYRKVDISDYESLRNALTGLSFQQVFHLAAIANPRSVFQYPLRAVKANVIGSANVLEISRSDPALHLVIVGSSEQYRVKAGREVMFDEQDPVEPRSIYGATKLATEILGQEYVRDYHLNICFTRSFNHTGAGQLPDYVLSDFAKQCAEIRAGKRKPAVSVGNLNVSRDFTDVRDVVRVYALLAERGKAGEVYNVCAGKPYALRQLLHHLVALTGKEDVEIMVDPRRIRTDDLPVVYGSNRKLNKDTGWQPEIQIATTLSALFEYWLDHI